MVDDPEAARAASALTESSNRYAITLQTLVFPMAGHMFFHALAAAALLLIGHPWLAAASFVALSIVDGLSQIIIRRWLPTAAQTSERSGMPRVFVLCVVRTIAVMTPPVLAVFNGGGPAEIVLVGLQVCAILAVGQAIGSLSRAVFWAYVGPVLGVAALVVAVSFGGLAAGGLGISLASFSFLMWMLSHNTNRIMVAWRDAWSAKQALVGELEIARDEAAMANRAKSNFLATMSHEIRTPMNGVLGMAQLLKRDETDPVQMERLGVLIDSGEYLLSILNDILDISKVDAGKLDIVPAPESLRPFLTRLVGFWSPHADEKGVALSLRVADGVPDAVLVDALRLRQVLFNLIGNALKFTDEGLVEVAVDAMPNGAGAVLLLLSVRDTGPGIAPEHISTLFDRFSQADPSEIRRFGGTGLGLAIAKQLIDLMGGRLWAQSTLGQGSTFHIKLPLALAPALTASVAETGEETAADLASLRVLCVDDNPVNLLVLEQLLSSLGCDIVKASGGAEALDLLGAEVFDLVLMDIQMPGMSGIEALQRLRASTTPNAGAPVVALTADVTSGGRERYLALGFDEHSSKPIQLADLLAAMDRALRVETAAFRPAAGRGRS